MGLCAGFVLMCNVSSAVMFVLLEYCLEINYVDDPFNVATVRHMTDRSGALSRCLQIKDRNSLNFKTISIITFALTWVSQLSRVWGLKWGAADLPY